MVIFLNCCSHIYTCLNAKCCAAKISREYLSNYRNNTFANMKQMFTIVINFILDLLQFYLKLRLLLVLTLKYYAKFEGTKY